MSLYLLLLLHALSIFAADIKPHDGESQKLGLRKFTSYQSWEIGHLKIDEASTSGQEQFLAPVEDREAVTVKEHEGHNSLSHLLTSAVLFGLFTWVGFLGGQAICYQHEDNFLFVMINMIAIAISYTHLPVFGRNPAASLLDKVLFLLMGVILVGIYLAPSLDARQVCPGTQEAPHHMSGSVFWKTLVYFPSAAQLAIVSIYAIHQGLQKRFEYVPSEA